MEWLNSNTPATIIPKEQGAELNATLEVLSGLINKVLGRKVNVQNAELVQKDNIGEADYSYYLVFL